MVIDLALAPKYKLYIITAQDKEMNDDLNSKLNFKFPMLDEDCYSLDDQSYRRKVFDLQKCLDMVIKLDQIDGTHHKLSVLENKARRQLCKSSSLPDLNSKQVCATSATNALDASSSSASRSSAQPSANINVNHRPSQATLQTSAIELIPRLLYQQEQLFQLVSDLKQETKNLRAQLTMVQSMNSAQQSLQSPLKPQTKDISTNTLPEVPRMSQKVDQLYKDASSGVTSLNKDQKDFKLTGQLNLSNVSKSKSPKFPKPLGFGLLRSNANVGSIFSPDGQLSRARMMNLYLRCKEPVPFQKSSTLAKN